MGKKLITQNIYKNLIYIIVIYCTMLRRFLIYLRCGLFWEEWWWHHIWKYQETKRNKNTPSLHCIQHNLFEYKKTLQIIKENQEPVSLLFIKLRYFILDFKWINSSDLVLTNYLISNLLHRTFIFLSVLLIESIQLM